MVSAHQSIGCGAIIYFGNEDQKRRYLPRLASDTLSAFCLSEPNVGSDAGGQETVATMSEDGKHYILNGEKKWATSAAMAGLFTVMAKQQITDPNTGEKKERISAFICEPDMKGIEVFSRNRSKCGIRGTWQGRLRFKDVIVPMENLLHDEGKGLNVALTCLDIGRCTLSAGMLGAAGFAMEQGVKWATTRYQFERPLSEFELIQNKIATMAAYTYAMDAMLYMTTGMLDRGDEDIMLETAICKVFSSEMGYRTVDHAMQIMGGEGYMTENVIERLWRDSRINTIVEGANEVMASFIFAYGSKQMGEFMLDIKEHPLKHLGDAVKMGVEVFAGILPDKPRMRRSHSQLAPFYDQLESHIQELAHQTKLMFKEHKESLITNQMIQSRLSTMVMWIHALMCSLSKLEKYMAPQSNGSDSSYDFAIVSHLFALGGAEIEAAKLALYDNCDHTMRYAAKEVMEKVGKMPNDQYIIPEKTRDKNALGSGKIVDKKDIPQFGNGFI
jgi:alkylation response protein AidB-like acyl-CoA dehydrogenase